MLMEFLEKAAAIGCKKIEIEYKDRKEWITGFRGCVGWGIGCLDSDQAKPIFKDMDELKRRKEVTMVAPDIDWSSPATKALENGSIGFR